MSEKETLSSEINSAIQDIAQQKEIEGIKSLSRYNPEKVAKILYLFSTGVSQTSMVRKYGIDRETIINTLIEGSISPLSTLVRILSTKSSDSDVILI